MGNCVCRPPRSPSESVVASAIAAAAAEGAARLVRAPSSLERKATTTTTTTPLEVDRARVDGVGDDDDDDDDDASSYRSGRSSFASDDDDDDDGGGGGDRVPSLARSPRNATTTTTTTKTTLALAQPAPPPDTPPAMDARVAQLLASASEHLEDDAIERLCDDGDDGDAGAAAAAATTTTTTTTTKKKTKRKGALARVARVASGMRMMRSMTKAARAAGGSLDLTAFAGTPIRWHARTSVLRTHAVGESSLKPPAAAGAGGPASTRPPPRGSPGERERRRPRATRLFTQLQRDFGARSRALREAARARGIAGEADRSRDDGDGGDGDGEDERKSKFSSPFFAVERQHSIEALEDLADLEDDHAAWDNVSVDYGDDGEVHGEIEVDVDVDVDADEARDVDVATTVPPPASTPEGRILRVVRALLADAEPPAHLQKPFNPVLGETARHELHLSNGVEIRSVLEQVTHHPPVTAFHRREARVRPLPARRAPFASPSVRRSLRLAARMHSFQRD